MSELRKGSLRNHLNTVYMTLLKDDELMRWLHYKPENEELGLKHPQDPSLANIATIIRNDYGEIISEDINWDVVDKCIRTTPKSSDIEEEAICRLYVYPGRRRPVFNNDLVVKQEIIVDVLVHESFSSDLRMEAIIDRLNELISLERITGFGVIDIAAGNPRQAPMGYSKYENIYLFGDGKK